MKRITFFVPNLHGGGAERVAVNLLKGMVGRDISLDLVLANAEGKYLHEVPEKVRVVNLATGRVLTAILPLSVYLKRNRPDALVSHLNHANVVAVLARELAAEKTKLILVEHDTLSAGKFKSIRARCVPQFMKWFYPRAEAIVGVSKGVAEDLEFQLGLPKGRVNIIYNPVVDDELMTKAKMPLEHPWFQTDSPPIFLAVGRLTPQKDFSTLIKAFALFRKQRAARLVILGEGESRTELEAMINTLGIIDDVSMPGFVANPFAYMSKSSAFILSSRWEGLGNALIEAMACGCPVISTDCPSGPQEILAGGKYGELVSVGDSVALAKSMLQVLENPLSRDVLIERAKYFSVDRAVTEYLSLLC
ncbi:MAG: glycosyltransferase [Stigonema ocellatum SAG 48.90 = DSM 106950]|nr:glycosyltransferase [Stigonema ocellatum SAG 48.90 = DSM 106950]